MEANVIIYATLATSAMLDCLSVLLNGVLPECVASRPVIGCQRPAATPHR